MIRGMITWIVRRYLKYCPISDLAPDGPEPGLRGRAKMQALAMALYETATWPSPLEVQMAGDSKARWDADLGRLAIERLGDEVRHDSFDGQSFNAAQQICAEKSRVQAFAK